MQINKLDHRCDYEWFGTFWFPEQPNEQFSSKLSYTPEKGIQVSLLVGAKLTLSKPHSNYIAKKIMHGIVADTKYGSTKITLFGVFFSVNSFARAFPTTLFGIAHVIVVNEFLGSDMINAISIDYDDNFYNLLMYEKDVKTTIKYLSNSPAEVDGTKFSMSYHEIGKGIGHQDDFDNILWSINNDSTDIMDDFKKLIAPFLKTHKFKLLRRTDTTVVVKIESNEKAFDCYREEELIWRRFWELLADTPISILHSWIYVTGEKALADGELAHGTFSYPILCNSFMKPKHWKEPLHHVHMPLTIKIFGETAYNLSVLNTPLTNWFRIEKEWNNLFIGVHDIIHNKTIIQKDFVMLMSYIDTMINIVKNSSNIKGKNDFIKHYATQNLFEKISELVGYVDDGNDNRKKNNLGRYIREVRNAIVHPLTSNKDDGKFLAIANNGTKLQNLYGNMAGLFMKAFMQQVYDVSDEDMNKYLDNFINQRATFQRIEYE